MKKEPKFTIHSPVVIERCINPVASPNSLICPSCGTPEVFCNANDPDNTDQWFWAIRAYRVDDYSECRSCGDWFRDTKHCIIISIDKKLSCDLNF